MHWSNWKSLCALKFEGGLGFRDLAKFNIALFENLPLLPMEEFLVCKWVVQYVALLSCGYENSLTLIRDNGKKTDLPEFWAGAKPSSEFSIRSCYRLLIFLGYTAIRNSYRLFYTTLWKLKLPEKLNYSLKPLLCVHGDSLTVICKLLSPRLDVSVLGPYIRDIIAMVAHICGCHFLHVLRIANQGCSRVSLSGQLRSSCRDLDRGDLEGGGSLRVFMVS
ncbi:hypothetical protein Golax_020630, partial [Gossypium laxum]|nr:hypothetical protein [Gossypium laxum]